MKLNDAEIVVAIENAVCDQLEASGITADPFRLDGEKIVQVILDQLGDYVLVPKEPTSKILQAMKKANDNGIHATQIYRCGLQYKAMIEAQEPAND